MATPGALSLTVYYGAAHNLTLSFQDSNGDDYDISSYSSFKLNLYPLNSLTAEDEITLTRSGSDLTYSFPKADIQGYTKNMRLEVLFDDTIVLRGKFTVTDVQGTDTISTSAEVKLDGSAAVITVADVVVTNELSTISSQTNKATPADTDRFAGQESGGSVFSTTWANIKSAIKTWLQSNFGFTDLSDGTITNGADNDLLTLESGVWVNKTREEVLQDNEAFKKSAYGTLLPYQKIVAWDNFQRDDENPITTADSGQSYSQFGSNPIQISGNEAKGTSNGNFSGAVLDLGINGAGYQAESWVFPFNAFGKNGCIIATDADNYFYFDISRTGVNLYKVVSGVETNLYNKPYSAGSNQTRIGYHVSGRLSVNTTNDIGINFMVPGMDAYFESTDNANSSVWNNIRYVGIYSSGSLGGLFNFKVIENG